MRLWVGASKDGGTESIGVERQGITGNPVSDDHHPTPSHCMKIQWKWIDTYHEVGGGGQVWQNSKKASKGENAIECTMCHRNQQHGTKVKPYHLPGAWQ